METWLHANGFTDIFVDHHGIAGGEKWREALRASAGACRVVVCLVTENWLASHECFSEFLAAWYMGKRIIPLFLFSQRADLSAEAEQRLARVCAEDQGVDLATCIGRDAVLDIDADRDVAGRLKTGLRAAGAISRVGLDPEAFAIDRKLPPYPVPGPCLVRRRRRRRRTVLWPQPRDRRGAGRTAQDARRARPAAVRDSRSLGRGKIVAAQGRHHPAPAARGAGVAAAAGVPSGRRSAAELRRGALRAPWRTSAKTEAHGVIRDRLLDVWSKAERAEGRLDSRRSCRAGRRARGRGPKAARWPPGAPARSILVSVDQAEEMARADGNSAEALADYLRVALAATSSSWQLAFTIRTDSFPELQSHRRFQDLRGARLRPARASRSFASTRWSRSRRSATASQSTMYSSMR